MVQQQLIPREVNARGQPLPKLPGADCEQCPFKDDFFVPPEPVSLINTQHKFVLMGLGMHPGREEVEKGQVFIGPSGKILRQTWDQLGFENKYALFNAVPCEPEEDNDAINEKARMCCEPAIHRIINNAQPDVLVAMGPEGLKTAGVWRGAILEFHGTIDESAHLALGKQKVLSSVHPAYLLRESNATRFKDWYDAVQFSMKNDRNPVPHPIVNVLWDGNVTEISELLVSIPKDTSVSIDIETQGLKLFQRILCVSLSWDGNLGYVIPWPEKIHVEFDYEQQQWIPQVPDEHAEFYSLMKGFLESSDYRFCLQNAMFDVPYFKAYDINITVVDDTLLQSHVINENAFEHGLKERCRMRYSWPEWDAPVHAYLPSGKKRETHLEFDWGTIPPKDLYPYAGWDAVGTAKLRDDNWKEMDEDDKWVYENITIPTLNMFAQLRFNGMRMNLSHFPVLYDTFMEELLELEEKCRKVAWEYNIIPFNPNSPLDTVSLLFDKDKLALRPPGGVRDSNKKTLAQLPKLGIVQNIIRFREVSHDINTDVTGLGNWVAPDHCIHPMFRLTLVTGRGASTDPSVSNIKGGSKVRELWIPKTRNGRKYLVFDADESQFEVRTYAGIAKARLLQEIFARGDDVHDTFMYMINPQLSDEQLKQKGFRTRTKNVVFGKLYNAGVHTTADSMMQSVLDELGRNEPDRFAAITEPNERGLRAYAQFRRELIADAGRISKAIEKLCPELRQYTLDRIREMDRTHQVKSPLGRKRRMPLIPKAMRKHFINVAVNSPVQGTANDLNWLSMLLLCEMYDQRATAADIYLWMSIHDSIVGEMAEDNWQQSTETILNVMETRPKEVLLERGAVGFEDIVFKADLKIGRNWGNMTKVKRSPKGILYLEDPSVLLVA